MTLTDMQQTTRQFSYFVFLLPVFFILHAVNEHYGLIPFHIAARYLVYYMVLSAALLLAGRFIFSSTEKGGIWSFGLLMVFYFFGAVHDFLKELKIPSFLVSYSFILPTLLVFFILFTALIRKRKRKFIKLTFFLNILFSLFVLVELALLFFGVFTNKEKRLSLSGDNKPIDIEINRIDERLKPDIFFIIFDEYASSASLKKYLNFNNENLDSFFLQKGCYIVHKSKSNYNSTGLSIPSIFNMNYHGQPLEGEHTLPTWYSAVVKQQNLA